MKRIFTVALCVFFLFSILGGCASNRERGAGIGAISGALLGAMAFGGNSWQAALIGGIGGAIVGGLIGDAVDAKEESKTRAASTGERVVYYDDNDQAVESTPLNRTKTIYADNMRTDCRKVQTKIYKNGNVVSDEINEVCTSTKSTSTY